MLNIKVVGSGCPTCQKLEAMCKDVVRENNIDAEIEKITELDKFADLGIMMTPGLLLNENVVSSGKLPTQATLAQWIIDANKS